MTTTAARYAINTQIPSRLLAALDAAYDAAYAEHQAALDAFEGEDLGGTALQAATARYGLALARLGVLDEVYDAALADDAKEAP